MIYKKFIWKAFKKKLYLKDSSGEDINSDGKIIKSGYSVVANTKDGCNLRKGSSSGGPVIGNIKDGKNIRDGQSSGGKILCNIRDGKNIRDGQSSGGKVLIKISDAAKKIGSSSVGPSTALVWWFIAK